MGQLKAKDHELFMQRCLELGASGLGQVAPNPLVGCVIVRNGKIIGEGYHRVFGGPHAEVEAFSSVSASENLQEASLYVNLEPCCHHGKTPPCTDLIIGKGIRKVVIGATDPNPLVAGNGVNILRESGCEVETGVLEEACRRLNKRFYTFHEKHRPYVILKWAQTSDGFIDIRRLPGQEARPTWITSEKLRMLVHKWRSEESAIMAGTNTALLDNPRLNVRDWTGKQPVRVVMDRQLRLPPDLDLFDNSQPTLVFNNLKDEDRGNTKLIRVDFQESPLKRLLEHIYTMGLQSIFVEGGRQLIQSFIDEDLWDEARVFCGPRFFGQGVSAPVIGRRKPARIPIGKELFFWFRNLPVQ
jgi:diaminohydroxyphosphoribosylaminopyrimidine deaminase / 5-amino-6-(5-phosphoribosylamino)uracil reductase